MSMDMEASNELDTVLLEEQLAEQRQRIEQLTELVEDLAGNLEDAATSIADVAEVLFPGHTHRDVEAYRKLIKEVRSKL